MASASARASDGFVLQRYDPPKDANELPTCSVCYMDKDEAFYGHDWTSTQSTGTVELTGATDPASSSSKSTRLALQCLVHDSCLQRWWITKGRPAEFPCMFCKQSLIVIEHAERWNHEVSTQPLLNRFLPASNLHKAIIKNMAITSVVTAAITAGIVFIAPVESLAATAAVVAGIVSTLLASVKTYNLLKNSAIDDRTSVMLNTVNVSVNLALGGIITGVVTKMFGTIPAFIGVYIKDYAIASFERAHGSMIPATWLDTDMLTTETAVATGIALLAQKVVGAVLAIPLTLACFSSVLNHFDADASSRAFVQILAIEGACIGVITAHIGIVAATITGLAMGILGIYIVNIVNNNMIGRRLQALNYAPLTLTALIGCSALCTAYLLTAAASIGSTAAMLGGAWATFVGNRIATAADLRTP